MVLPADPHGCSCPELALSLLLFPFFLSSFYVKSPSLGPSAGAYPSRARWEGLLWRFKNYLGHRLWPELCRVNLKICLAATMNLLFSISFTFFKHLKWQEHLLGVINNLFCFMNTPLSQHGTMRGHSQAGFCWVARASPYDHRAARKRTNILSSSSIWPSHTWPPAPVSPPSLNMHFTAPSPSWPWALYPAHHVL